MIFARRWHRINGKQKSLGERSQVRVYSSIVEAVLNRRQMAVAAACSH